MEHVELTLNLTRFQAITLLSGLERFGGDHMEMIDVRNRIDGALTRFSEPWTPSPLCLMCAKPFDGTCKCEEND